jgi:hypothetical protein
MCCARPQAELRAARERTAPTDATTLRAEKIARFKRDKEARGCQRACACANARAMRADVALRARAAALRAAGGAGGARRRARQRAGRRCVHVLLVSASSVVRSHAHAAAERESDAAGDGEEEAREAWTLRIGTAVLKALDLAPSLATEAQLLALRAAGPARARMPPPERPALAAGVAAAAMALARQPERQRLQAGVFRPSHILPTMTIEEFGA